jgi:hypothetical protein
MRTFKFHPRVKFMLEILALVIMLLMIAHQSKAQSVKKAKPMTQAQRDSAERAAIYEIMYGRTTQKWLDSIINGSGANTYVSESVGVNPVSNQTGVVPGPTMTSTATQSDGRLGVRQAIIFTPRGNTRLVTVIRIR